MVVRECLRFVELVLGEVAGVVVTAGMVGILFGQEIAVEQVVGLIEFLEVEVVVMEEIPEAR